MAERDCRRESPSLQASIILLVPKLQLPFRLIHHSASPAAAAYSPSDSEYRAGFLAVFAARRIW